MSDPSIDVTLLQKEVTWNIFAVAAQMMRRILVDYARKHKALKRSGSMPKTSLEQAAVFSKEQTHEMLVVDELLTKLASFDPQGGRIVELRFYGGLSVEETAEVMSISSAKVIRLTMASLCCDLRTERTSRSNILGLP